MFVGMQFCPNCGVKAARELVDDATELPCPGCATHMRAIRVGTTPMHECPSCTSTWLETHVFNDLCLNREERASVAISIGVATLSGPLDQSKNPVRYVPCAVCRKIMNRVNFGHRSGILIDLCKGHGLWFERDELARALAFVESGGLERARAEDQARQAEELRTLSRSLQDSAIMRAGPHVVSLRRDDEPAADSLLRDVLEKLLS